MNEIDQVVYLLAATVVMWKFNENFFVFQEVIAEQQPEELNAFKESLASYYGAIHRLKSQEQLDVVIREGLDFFDKNFMEEEPTLATSSPEEFKTWVESVLGTTQCWQQIQG